MRICQRCFQTCSLDQFHRGKLFAYLILSFCGFQRWAMSFIVNYWYIRWKRPHSLNVEQRRIFWNIEITKFAEVVLIGLNIFFFTRKRSWTVFPRWTKNNVGNCFVIDWIPKSRLFQWTISPCPPYDLCSLFFWPLTLLIGPILLPLVNSTNTGALIKEKKNWIPDIFPL